MIELLSSPFATALTLTLLHFLWQAVLVALGYWTFHEAVGVRSARIRYATALIALIVMTASPLLTFWTVLDTSATGTEAQPANVVLDSDIASPEESRVMSHQKELACGLVAEQKFLANQTAGKQSGSLHSLNSIQSISQPYVLLLWIAGVLLSGARLTAGFETPACGYREKDLDALHQQPLP